jgi:predicted alpha/beta hydrolase family esterase
MIHYHGTPIGGTRVDVVRFLQGRHALVPFFRADDVAAVMEVCQSFVLDNSAFSLWKKGGDVPVAEYHRWVHEMAGHPGLDWCLIPDKIDGDEEQNQQLVTNWLREGCEVLSVPVWHMHESLDWLAYLVDKFQTVALGSSGQWATPGTDAWWVRMGSAMDVACNSIGRPKARLHGLRMLDPRIFTRLPLSSADSTNAAVHSGSVSRFGMYPPPTAGQRADVVASRTEAHNSAHIWQRSTQADLFGGGAA